MQLVADTSKRPRGWRLSTVGESCAIRDELRLPLNVAQRKARPGPYPYYGPTGVLDSIDEYRAEGTYVLIGEDGDHFLKYDEWPMTQLVTGRFNVNNHAHVLQGRDGCGTQWVFHYLHHMNLRPLLTLQGVGRYKLTRAALETIPLLIPPPREQEAIDRLLCAWAEGAAQLRNAIELKKTYYSALSHELLSGHRRHSRFRRRVWKASPLGTFLSESRNLGGRGTGRNKITVRLYGKGVIANERNGADSSSTQFYVRRAGQLIYSRLDFLNGAFGIVPPSLDGYESTSDLPAFDIGHGVNARWLVRFLSRRDFYARQLGMAVGGRKARRVKPSDFLKIEIPIPALDEQGYIADVIDCGDNEIGLLEREQLCLEQQKKGLMQRLLTGKTRLKG